MFATHISPLHFKNPREFHPERWLGDAEYADDHFGAMEAFSVGPRNCLGKNLAWHEARLLLATLLLHFDVSLAEGVARVDPPAAVYAVGEAAIDGQPHASSQGIARVTANLTPLQELVIDLPDITPCIGSSNFDRVIIMIVLLLSLASQRRAVFHVWNLGLSSRNIIGPGGPYPKCNLPRRCPFSAKHRIQTSLLYFLVPC